MAEKQIAQAFSEQVDRLLAGQAAPGDDPLLSLAADLTPGAALDPAPAFVRRLRGQLLQSVPPRRALRLRRWSLAGAALSLLVVLALTLLYKPRTLSAAEVLARAADAVAVDPGQIEYVVLQIDNSYLPDDWTAGADKIVVETWNHVAVSQDDLLTVAERTLIAYAASDPEFNQPLYQVYDSPTLFCSEMLDPSFPDSPELRDCITMDPVEPGPTARQATESLQDWIVRMQASEAEIEFHETEFAGRPVYSLTYLEENHSVTASSDAPDEPLTVTKVGVSTDTVTVYIDRETYLPIGKFQQRSDPDYYSPSETVMFSFTQTVLQYQVLNPEDLDFDPFAWPPAER